MDKIIPLLCALILGAGTLFSQTVVLPFPNLPVEGSEDSVLIESSSFNTQAEFQVKTETNVSTRTVKPLNDSIERNVSEKTSPFKSDTSVSVSPFFNEMPPAIPQDSGAKSIYLSLETKESTFYKGQLVPLDYKLLVLSELEPNIQTQFTDARNLTILNPQNPWTKSDENTWTNRYYAYIRDTTFTLPTIITKIQIGAYEEQDILSPKDLSAVELRGSDIFSGIIAESFKVLNHKANTYDRENNILVMEAKAQMGRIDHFQVPLHGRQGIESSTLEAPESTMIYYVILPKSDDFFIFEYFDSNLGRFETVKVPNIAKDDPVSTQSDIRPKRTLQLSQLALMAAVVLFGIVMFAIRRKSYFLIIALLAGAYLGYLLIPQKVVKIRGEAPIRILPSSHSTNFFSSPYSQSATVLGSKHGYYKIELIDGQIGWVRKDNVLKD